MMLFSFYAMLADNMDKNDYMPYEIGTGIGISIFKCSKNYY